MKLRMRTFALMLAIVMTACSSAVAERTSTAAGTSATTGGEKENGRRLFTANCSSCHGATGTEGGYGPSLRNLRERMNYAAAVSWIEDPEPPMPKLYPRTLSDTQVRDLAAYVETL
jgi:ubiquinol-cytochrome c reductase cytochrome c subunit